MLYKIQLGDIINFIIVNLTEREIKILNYITLGITKFIDNLVTTSKTLCVQRNKPLLVGLLVTISQILFYTIVSKVVADGSTTVILIVSFCAGLGSMVALPINNKFSKDITYINIITTINKDDMKELADYLRNKCIQVVSFNSYNPELESTLTVLVFAKTRNESKIIDRYLEQSPTKYLRQITTAK